jgi:tetratricopeptide (TPR) repeat protein
MIGMTLGPYRVLEKLGEGGMGEVYRAHDSRLGRDVALKVLPAEFAADPERLQRFEREARATAALSHPNILAVYDLGTYEGTPFIVEELVEGESLRERLSGGPVPVTTAVELASQIARGLAAAHEKHIVHRDLKPDNVIVTRDGVAKILDFGLAKFVDPRSPDNSETLTRAPAGETESGRVLGTIAYMAPEQARGAAVDHRADIFALGVVLYEMLAGSRPFAGVGAIDTLSAILKDDPKPLPSTVPSGLQGVVRRCLEKRPDDRFATAREVLAALQATTTDPVGAPPVVERAARRWPRVAMALAAVGLAVVAVTVGLVVRSRGTAEAPAPALDPKRVLVTPLENLTGDPALDTVARLAMDAVTTGLAELKNVEVVEPGPDGAGAGSPDARLALATAKKAGTIVSGSYSLRGDSLELRARLLDTASGKLLYALDPASGPRNDPGQAVDALKQRVMGAVSYHFASFFGGNFGRPVPYEAYREFVAGSADAGFDWKATLAHTERAVEIDPEFWAAQLRLVAAYSALGDPAKAAAALARVEKASARLSPTELLQFEYLKARGEGRRLDALEAARKHHALVPRDPVSSYMAASLALTLNRPKDALTLLGDMQALDWTEMAKWRQGTWFVRVSAQAHHYLREYDGELADVALCLKYYPGDQSCRENQVRVLAAQGKLDELNRAIEESLASPSSSGYSAGTVMLEAAEELRAHGHPDEAVRIAQRAEQWYAARRPDDAEGEVTPANRAEILWMAGRWKEARDVAEQFARDNPRSMIPEGLRGVMAARAGDRKTAAACDAFLSAIDRPTAKGPALVWRAYIAAQLGERDRAVEFLRDAFAKGAAFDRYLHRYVYLEPLQGYAPFEELLNPKG